MKAAFAESGYGKRIPALTQSKALVAASAITVKSLLERARTHPDQYDGKESGPLAECPEQKPKEHMPGDGHYPVAM